MLKELQSLLVVQDRDLALKKLEKEMIQVPKDVERENLKLKDDRDKLEAETTKLKEMEVKAGQIKLDRRTRQDTVQKLKVQQFETKKNDEYNALGAEAQRYQAQVDELETEELILLEECDEQRSVVADCEKALAERQEMVTANINDLKEKARHLVARFKEAKVARSESTQGADAEALGLYERILKSKGDIAIVEAQEGVCLGCHIKLVPSTVLQLRAKKEIVQCENCGRMLFEVE